MDTNILVYAHRAEAEWNQAAYEALAELQGRLEPWAIPWSCVHEFLCVVTNGRIFAEPTPQELAQRQVEAWMESPTLRLLGERPGHWLQLRRLLAEGRMTGPRVYDARIAAICLEHGVRELWSADRDFSRMAGLRVRNPLLGRS
ncbi:MAG TPA: TA system VapC family ribonuclease toxin [Terriglobales bacterium]|nr:TA system VapC family ribonuclease toxin [Terriglobales bacterium]